MNSSCLFEYLSNHGAKVPARKTLMKDLVAQSNEIKAEMKRIIENTTYICTTADVLTAMAKSFLGVTMHYFDEHLVKQSLIVE